MAQLMPQLLASDLCTAKRATRLIADNLMQAP